MPAPAVTTVCLCSFCLRSADMRSQSSRFKTILAAAADSGESASLTSTQAQAAPDCVMAAMAERAKDVLPVDAAPANLGDASARNAAAQHGIDFRHAG